jgi:hypothetical protein
MIEAASSLDNRTPTGALGLASRGGIGSLAFSAAGAKVASYVYIASKHVAIPLARSILVTYCY